MTTEQTEGEHSGIVERTVIETSWLCAQSVHGKAVPAWLYQTLAHAQQQASELCLPVVVLPACGQDESLVVMTLGDFLFWSHRRAGLNTPAMESHPHVDIRRNA